MPAVPLQPCRHTPPRKASEEAFFARVIAPRRHHPQPRLRPRRAPLLAALAAVEASILVEGARNEVEKVVGHLGGELPLVLIAEGVALRPCAGAAPQELRVSSRLASLRSAAPSALEAPGEILDRRHHGAVSYPSVIVPSEPDVFLGLGINARLEIEAGGEKFAGTFATVAQGGDDVGG